MMFGSVVLPFLYSAFVYFLVPEEWKTVRITAAVYGLAVVLVWLISSQIGSNITRLSMLFAGVALLAALPFTVPASRKWYAIVVAFAGFVVWIGYKAVDDVVHTTPAASWARELAPLVNQLQVVGAEKGRVEVVPARSHREASALAPYVNLARGWNRQADAARNRVFYRDQPLTAEAYQRWLSRWAVRFVVLSTADPDAAAVEEAALVSAGLPYLEEVWSDDDWTVYEVQKPRALVSWPARVLAFDAAQVTLYAPEPGPVVVRVAYSRWLGLLDEAGRPLPPESGACLSGLATDRGIEHPRDNWLVLHATEAGVYRIGAPYKVPRGSACSS
jgi:hypothetical protein